MESITINNHDLLNTEQILPDLRIGIVGLGYWGPKLARNFHDLRGAKLIRAVDIKQDRLEDFTLNYPDVQTSNEFNHLLRDDIDAVVIATPVNLHYHLAKMALLAGKHVLVEKPITDNSINATELVNIAAAKNLTLMVGHTFVYNPAVEAVKEIIKSGELGDIYYINATRVNLGLLQPDINVMWDLAPHDLSITNFILAEDPVKVSAVGSVYVNKSSRLDEVVYINLVYASGILANMRVSWLDPVKQRRITVVGSKKMLVYDDIADDKVILYDKGVDVPAYSTTEQEFRASYRHGPETKVAIKWIEPLKQESSHFIECIRFQRKPRSSGDEGLKVVRIMETAQRSLNNGGEFLEVE